MAEKEERYISITQMVAKENIETEKYRVMPRSEAIERIAKKICAYSWETLNELAQARYMERAEAALNALLEEDK